MKRRPTHWRTLHQVESAEKTAPAWICVPVEDVFADIMPQRAEQDSALAPLAASIARHGLLQPIVVRRAANQRGYLLVCGTRRLAACKLLGMKEIDALLISADEAQATACFLEEHETHVKPSFLYTAQSVRRVGTRRVEAACTMGNRYVRRLTGMLALRNTTQEIVESGRLTLEQSLPLLHLHSESRQNEAASIIAQRGLTPRQARRLVCMMRTAKFAGSAGKTEKCEKKVNRSKG